VVFRTVVIHTGNSLQVADVFSAVALKGVVEWITGCSGAVVGLILGLSYFRVTTGFQVSTQQQEAHWVFLISG